MKAADSGDSFMKLSKHRLRAASALCAVLAVFSVLLAGCGGGGGGPSGGSGTGSVKVSLADAVNPGVSSLVVVISRIDAHVVDVSNENDTDDSHWKTIVTGPITVDLLDLVKDDQLLGPAVDLPVGHYTQVRLILSKATITDATGTYDLNIPSGTQTGIKIHGGFDVQPNQVTAILLDFSVKGSLTKAGNGKYILKPVPSIVAVVEVLSGTVTGKVVDSGGAAIDGATVTATYTAGSNYALGTVVNTTGTLADGTFKIWALLPGTYTITATDASGNSVVKTGVVVSANNNTAVGTLQIS
jgi:hypothetical protein